MTAKRGMADGGALVLLRVNCLPIESLAPWQAEGSVARLGRVFEVEDSLAEEAQRLGEDLFQAAGARREDEGVDGARRRLEVVALRRAIHNRRPVPASLLAAVRDTLRPELVARLDGHLERRGEVEAEFAAYRAGFHGDLARTREGLLAMAQEPLFGEGIRLVSRSLYERLGAMSKEAGAPRWGHDWRHAAAKLTSYAARFTTKTSPNSMFCATAIARIAAGGEALVAGENVPARVDYLLSVAEVRKVTACLGVDPAVRDAVVPRPNPTLRRQDGAWHFWRPASPRNPTNDEVRCRAGGQPVLDLILAATARGAATIDRLLAEVAEESGAEPEALAPFLGQLVEAGLLIAEVETPYNDRRPLRCLARSVRAAGCEPPWLAVAEAIEQAVDDLPALSSGARPAALDAVERRLTALPHNRAINGDELFRADTASALAVALPPVVIEDLRQPLGWYARLFAALYPEALVRAGWVKTFLARFPADEDVPLLDLYHGVFEPEPGQRPWAFPEPPQSWAAVQGAPQGAPPGDCAPAPAKTMRRVRERLAELAYAAAAAGEEEVVLDDAAWLSMLGERAEPPWSAGVLFQVAAASAGDVAAGRYRIALNALFSGAGIALARFAHLHGRGAPGEPIVREIARGWAAYGRPGAILAEVTYTHLGRSANAGLRPTVFRHEIELLGERATPGAEVIPLADLVVRYDGAQGRFVLRWASRGKEVVPVISSGISPEGFVSFLVEIGRQGMLPLSYFPGFDVAGVARWPRFTCGRVVLFRRRWVFSTAAAAGAGPPAPAPPAVAPGPLPEGPAGAGRRSGGPDEAAAGFFLEVARWRRAHGLPRHVFLCSEADPKPFYADLESPLFTELVRRALAAARGSALHVTEMLPGPDEMWVADRRGRYASEFLVHLRHLPNSA
ncbi:MAG TPA: lantibiotic dehydratase [Thermoanaerobaculia bacterium]|nr:lantibiotic dehydratase [Thermoanaerobaculia bacterium]